MRRRSIPLALAPLALALGLPQRPGTVVADTKVDLYVDRRGSSGRAQRVVADE